MSTNDHDALRAEVAALRARVEELLTALGPRAKSRAGKKGQVKRTARDETGPAEVKG